MWEMWYWCSVNKTTCSATNGRTAVAVWHSTVQAYCNMWNFVLYSAILDCTNDPEFLFVVMWTYKHNKDSYGQLTFESKPVDIWSNVGFCSKRSFHLLLFLGVGIWCYIWSASDWFLLCESHICSYTTEYRYSEQFIW